MFLNKFCSLNVYLKPLCIMFAGIRTNFSKNIYLVFGWFSSKINLKSIIISIILYIYITDGNRDQVPSLGRIKLTTSDEKFKKSNHFHFHFSLDALQQTNKCDKKRNNPADFPRKLYNCTTNIAKSTMISFKGICKYLKV